MPTSVQNTLPRLVLASARAGVGLSIQKDCVMRDEHDEGRTGILVGVGALKLVPLLAGACVALGILLGVCPCRGSVMRAAL